ncbi:MAG: hypothetical protein M1828_005408 [Chrysothrix sp. TS-e1954]|nr:MAG: hypothetical protein M1828_005408 [Chrysothrix sp. TS-e1954]
MLDPRDAVNKLVHGAPKSDDIEYDPLIDTARRPSDTGKSSVTYNGIPERKTFVDRIDAVALVVCYLCLAISIIIVRNGYLGWFLGYNNQLTVVGFLLSVEQFCIMRIIPSLLMMIEARFGRSFLQNFDAIMRMSMLASNVVLFWRLTIAFLLLLPTALSVGYKRFDNGNSTVALYSGGNQYGMTGPPGLDQIGQSVGLSLMVNSSLPFIVASAGNGTYEPPLPVFPQPYGFNTLILSNTSAAALDAPGPDAVLQIQSKLGLMEQRTVTADVTGTVASTVPDFDRSQLSNTNSSDPAVPLPSSDALSLIPMFQGQSVGLWTEFLGVGNSSFAYISIFDGNGGGTVDTSDPNFPNFTQNALQFFIKRQSCSGTWAITSNSISLIAGTCSDQPLPEDPAQLVFSKTTLALGDWYMPMLVEFLGPFGSKRSDSPWLYPTYCATVASMYWSRVTGLGGLFKYTSNYNASDIYEEQIRYFGNDHITSTRPTMRRSPLLLAILVTPAFICTLGFLFEFIFFTVPIGKGFGLTAILSGLDPSSTKAVYGASFSGILRKPIRLRIAPASAREGFEMLQHHRQETGANVLQSGLAGALPKRLDPGYWWRNFWLNVRRDGHPADGRIVYILGDGKTNTNIQYGTKYE